MSAFEQTATQAGAGREANTVARRLLGVAPAAVAIAYPFLLDGFHLAVSPPGARASMARTLAAALWLLAAMAAPLFGLACAFRLSKAAGSNFDLRARRLAYFSVAAPPLYVFAGVALGLLHSPVRDQLVWVAVWLAAGAAVLLGGKAVPKPAAGSVAKWRIVHGVAAAVIAVYVLFHLANHLLGLLGPEVHAAVMKAGRQVYRSPLVEPVLVGLLLFQVASGARLAWRWSASPADLYRVFQIGSGAYLAAFLVAHLNSALVSARTVHRIDTNWAWAAGLPEGLIHDAWNIRLVPHYAFGVFFILAHLCSGLRGVAVAHGVGVRLANRLWAAGLVLSGLVSVTIISGLCGARF
jgi:hypothetical protein